MTSTATPRPTRCPAPTAKAIDLAYLTFQRSDLELAERFLLDFGLRTQAKSAQELYMRHTGPSPFCCRIVRGAEAKFIGLAFSVSDRADLHALSRVSGASEVEPVPGPGGGERVRLTDPSGFVVEAVSGRSEVEPLYRREPLPSNNPGSPTRINTPQRPPLVPPGITKLGHVALEVSHFRDTCAWYSEHFGLIPSDVQILPDGSPAVAFLRLDLGKTPADHHTVAIVQGYKAAFGHCAYEVVDADAVAMGQRFLREYGWRHAWGMGRHILGSQVFDYWNDPWGDKHEHYSDGDLFTADVPMGVHDVSRAAMAQWGPPMPRSFTRPELSIENLRALLRSLRESSDLTAAKLFQLLITFG